MATDNCSICSSCPAISFSSSCSSSRVCIWSGVMVPSRTLLYVLVSFLILSYLTWVSLGHFWASSRTFSLSLTLGMVVLSSFRPRKVSTLVRRPSRKNASFFIGILLGNYYNLRIDMDKGSLKVVYKNPKHNELMEERMADFLKVIKEDQDSEVRKIEERALAQSEEIRSKIISRGVEREDEVARKKNLGVNIEAKIRKSSKINQARMLKMEARHELIQKMRSELTNAMKDLVKDEKRYRELLIKLIVQAMLKLMDEEIEVKCLNRDMQLVQSVLAEAEVMFNKISAEATTTKITTKLRLNTNQPLDTEMKNLIGGVVLTSYNGRVVCINTLDARFKYCIEDSLPLLRQGLFGKQ